MCQKNVRYVKNEIVFFLLFFILRKKIGNLDGYRILVSFIKTFIASLLMGLVIYLCSFKIGMNLFIVISIGIASYLLLTFIFGVKEIKEFLKWILKRK